MTDLTPLRELLAKWDAASDRAWDRNELELRNGYDACHDDLKEAIAAIESANPWIPVEKGLPEPSIAPLDLFVTGLGIVYKGMRTSLVGVDRWARNDGVYLPGHLVTHYRRHVAEKGPSE